MSGPLRPVAHNIKRSRLQRGLSLSGLARSAGVSKSTLSDLENGNGNPSIDTLWSLARALNVPFAALFEDRLREEVSVVRVADAPVIAMETEGFVTRHILSRHGRREVELYVLELEAGFRRDAEPHGPGVVEHVIVMQGLVNAGPDGESTELAPGDCISFPADRPHHYHAIDGPARLLAVHDYA
jgi:transcriptional regulator with XRE-family HTH domain